MRRRAALCLLVALAGCGLIDIPRRRPLNFWVDEAALAGIRRVLVAPVVGSQVAPDLLASLEASLLAELTGTHRFQVVTPRQSDDDKKLFDEERRGRFDAESLVALGRRYHVDGVLLVRITSFRPYYPPQIGVQLNLASVRTGEAIWVFDDTFDAAHENVRLDVLHYRTRTLVDEASLHDWEMILLSPRRFGRYVAARIAASVGND